MEKLVSFSLIHRKKYIDLLKTSLLPECRRLYPGIDFVFIQDNAPSYREKAMQQFLRQNTPDFIAADEWTYSPDLNPLDSSKIQCTMEKRLHAVTVRKQNGGAIQHIFHYNRCDWILHDLMQ